MSVLGNHLETAKLSNASDVKGTLIYYINDDTITHKDSLYVVRKAKVFKGNGGKFATVSVMMDGCEGIDIFSKGLSTAFQKIADDGALGSSYTKSLAKSQACSQEKLYFPCDMNDNAVAIDVVSGKKSKGRLGLKDLMKERCRIVDIVTKLEKFTCVKQKDEAFFTVRPKFSILKMWMYESPQNEMAAISESLSTSFDLEDAEIQDLSDEKAEQARLALEEMKVDPKVAKIMSAIKDRSAKKPESKRKREDTATESEPDSEAEEERRRRRRKKKLTKKMNRREAAVEELTEDERPKKRRERKVSESYESDDGTYRAPKTPKISKMAKSYFDLDAKHVAGDYDDSDE